MAERQNHFEELIADIEITNLIVNLLNFSKYRNGETKSNFPHKIVVKNVQILDITTKHLASNEHK